MSKMRVKTKEKTMEVSYFGFNTAFTTRKELGCGTLFQRLFRGNDIINAEYKLDVKASTFGPTTKKLITEISDDGDYFKTEDGVTYFIDTDVLDGERYPLHAYSIGQLKIMFRTLKMGRRLRDGYGYLTEECMN